VLYVCEVDIKFIVGMLSPSIRPSLQLLSSRAAPWALLYMLWPSRRAYLRRSSSLLHELWHCR
jgi:hypothetical protein